MDRFPPLWTFSGLLEVEVFGVGGFFSSGTADLTDTTARRIKEVISSGGIVVSGDPTRLWEKDFLSSYAFTILGNTYTWGSNQAERTYPPSGGIYSSGVALTSSLDVRTYIASGGTVLTYFEGDNPVHKLVTTNDTYLYRQIPYGTTGTIENWLDITETYSDCGNLVEGVQFLQKTGFAGSDGKKFTIGFKCYIPSSQTNEGTCTSYGWSPILFIEASNSTAEPDTLCYIAFSSDGWWNFGRYNASSSSYDIDVYSLTEGIIPLDTEFTFVIHYDSSEVVSSDRIKVFIDGTPQIHDNYTPPSQNMSFFVRASSADYISVGGYSTHYLEYSTNFIDPFTFRINEVIFLDQTLVPPASLFPYVGTFNSPDWYLKFENALALGADSSGNSNDFIDSGSVPVEQYIGGSGEVFYKASGTSFTFHTELEYDSTTTQDENILFIIHPNQTATPTVYFAFYLLDDGVTYTRKLVVKYVDGGSGDFTAVATDQITEDQLEDILLLVNTSAPVASDRLKIYLNEELSTWEVGSTFPALGLDLYGVGGISSPYWYIAGSSVSDWSTDNSTVKLANTYLADNMLLSPSDLVGVEVPSFFGPQGWYLRYLSDLTIGTDYSGNTLNFSVVGGLTDYYWQPIYWHTTGVSLNLIRGTEPDPLGLSLYLYSGEEVSLSVTLQIEIDPITLVVPFSILGGGEALAPLIIPFTIYNTTSLVNVESATWGRKVVIGGVDVTLLVVKDISIEVEEDSSGISTLYVAPAPGVIDPLVYMGKPIELWWRQYTNNILSFERLRFRGFVAEVEWNADTRLIRVTADTQLPAQFNDMSKEDITALVGGLHSTQVWDDDDDKSGWTYAQERLSTTSNCVWHDENLAIKLSPITANRVGGVLTPHFTFTDSERFHETLQLNYAQRAEMVNQINISLSYAYQRKRHKEITFSWQHSVNDPCAFLRWPGNWQLCQRSMVESAAVSGTWVAISPITYTDVWAPGCYDCPPPGGGPGGAISNVICWNIKTISGFVNGEEVSIDPVTGEKTQNEGFAYDVPVDASHLCNGAHWRAAARWIQDVDEYYDLVIRSPDSIEAIGVVATTEEYQIQNEMDYSGWEDSIVPYGTEKPVGSLKVPGSDPGDVYLDGDEEAEEGSVNRDEFDAAQEVILASARGDILRSHRLTTVSFKVAYQPSLNLSHTVKVETPYLTAIGKVKAIRDVWDVDTGEASTELSLAISRHNGSGLIEDDTPLTPQDKPAVTEEEEFDSYIKLDTYIGGRETSAIYDEEAQSTWQGFLTNYLESLQLPDWSANPVINPKIKNRTYPYSFVVRGPEITEAHTQSVAVSSSATYDVVIPEDTLTIVA